MSDLNSRTTAEVLEHHLTYCQGANLEETMIDYAEDATLINMDGPKHGTAEIKAFFADSMTTCLPAETKYETIRQYVDGEIGYVVWKADSPYYTIPFGTDTYIIRNGKIVQQTYAGILEKK